MKIGIDAHNLEYEQTGVARYLLNMLITWKDRKDDNEYILYFQNKIPKNKILSSPKFRKKILKNPFGIKSNALWIHHSLPKALKKDCAEILFSPSYISPFLYRGKLAIALHDICYEAHPEWFSPLNKILLKEISKHSAQKADIIFTISQHSKSEIIKYYKVDPQKVYINYCAPDKKFQPTQDQKAIKEIKDKYKIKNEFIFYIGSMFNRRYIPEILQAFQKIKEKHPDYQLLLIGRNHTYPHIKIEKQIAIINKYFKEDAVLHHDNIAKDSDLNLLYNAAKITIYLSSYEGFGLPPVESMACGTPVITNKATSLAEVGNNAVLFVIPQNINNIAEGIEKLITDTTFYNTLKEKGLKKAAEFSWEKSALATINIIEDIE